MSPRTDLQLDFNNMLAERIGTEGIELGQLEKIEPSLRALSRGLHDLRKLGQMPYRDLPYQEDLLNKVRLRAEEIRSRYETVLVLGTGGSSLGALCLVQALASTAVRGCRIELCQDLHAHTWRKLARTLVPEKTFIIVVSKSGKTIETLAAFLYFRQWLLNAMGEKRAKDHLLFITDPKAGPLRKIAESEQLETMAVPPGVGGRFSVLSTVGLLPAACAGIEIGEVVAGARRMDERCSKEDLWKNPAMLSAALHYLADRQRGRKIRVVMPYDDRLGPFTDWFAQLWDESIGKLLSLKGEEIRTGTTVLKAEGSLDQHSQLQLFLEGPRDKVVNLVEVTKVAEDLILPRCYEQQVEFKSLVGRSVHDLLQIQKNAVEAALTRSMIPNLTWILDELNGDSLGQLLYLAEVETVLSGALYNINPFDQPGVEVIKKYVKGLLAEKGFEEYRQAIEGATKDRRFVI